MCLLLVLLLLIFSASPEPPEASISSHVLDIASGRPAEGVTILAFIEENGEWKPLGSRLLQSFINFHPTERHGTTRNATLTPLSLQRVVLGICRARPNIDCCFTSSTNSNGRVPWVTPNTALQEKNYKLRFMTGDYYGRQNISTFYPYVEVVFRIANASQHYHVPLTLSPYGYSTYRGS